VFSTVGKLLHSRFTAETLRGVWPGGFCLAFCNENWRAVTTALDRWAREVEQVQFTAGSGELFSVQARTGISRYPGDGYSQEALVSAAHKRLDREANGRLS
jgi:hypothetical protein